MKKTLITILRDRNISPEQYRQAADKLGTVLAVECDTLFTKDTVFVDTPLARTQGEYLKHEFVLVPILRSGLVLLPPFMRFYPKATIGFIGARRDEKTAVPELYYRKLPPITHDNKILLLDPMIATGGSATLAVKVLKEAGATEKQITLISFIAAPDGITHFQKKCPEVGLVIAQVDEGLDKQKRIIPGLGDFGDRYFGTNNYSFLEPFAKAYEQYIRASRARGRANGQNGLKGRFFRAPEFYKRLFIYRF